MPVLIPRRRTVAHLPAALPVAGPGCTGTPSPCAEGRSLPLLDDVESSTTRFLTWSVPRNVPIPWNDDPGMYPFHVPRNVPIPWGYIPSSEFSQNLKGASFVSGRVKFVRGSLKFVRALGHVHVQIVLAGVMPILTRLPGRVIRWGLEPRRLLFWSRGKWEQCCFIFESQTTHVNMLRQHATYPFKKNCLTRPGRRVGRVGDRGWVSLRSQRGKVLSGQRECRGCGVSPSCFVVMW